MDVDEIDLSQFGAEEFVLKTRLDMSEGSTDPHLNADLVNPDGKILRYEKPADFRDLVNTQIPGFNSMQNSD